MLSNPNSLTDVLDQLSSTPDLPLLFRFNGNTIGNGYHVTEIKLADITSVDCGNGSDYWQEIIIQLLDGASEKPAMTCRKFRMIVDKGRAGLKFSENSRLLFEYSPPNGTLLRLQVERVSNQTNLVLVELTGLQTECKPFSRALAGRAASFCAGVTGVGESAGKVESTRRSCC